MAVTPTGPKFTVPSVVRIDAPEAKTTPLLDEPMTDLAWVARAGTLPPPRPAPIAGVAAPIDAEFPQLQPGSPQMGTLRETLTNDLFRATGGDPAKLVEVQQAVDRLAPALAQSTSAEAQKLIAAEIKRLVPDPEALKVTLKVQGYSGAGPVMSKGNPTAEAFSGEVAKHVSGSIRIAQFAIGKAVVTAAKTALEGGVTPDELKGAFRRAMSIETLGQSARGFRSRATMEANLATEMRRTLRAQGVATEPLEESISKLSAKAADAVLETNVKSLVAKGFTEASARAYTFAPSVEHAGAEVGKAIFQAMGDAIPVAGSKMHAPAEVEAFFARQAREGFENLGKNLISELNVTPADAEKIVKRAMPLFAKELAAQNVPRGVVASMAALASGPKPVLSNADGAAKVASWGERVMAQLPTPVTNAAKATGEAAQKLLTANPTLAKALPYVGRVVPYVNTPIAGLTIAHAVDVHNDPASWKVEALLADGAAGLNLMAAGSAYAPVPVLDWAASFTGGALSLGVSGLEWGTSSVRKALTK